MTAHLKIDFVSDIACPWCIIGLRALEEALVRAADALDAEIVFQPFELNPAMPAGGQNIGEHIAEKYGSTPEQSAANRAMIVDRARDLGFTMAMTETSRIYNTFDAHRLLHWAQVEGGQGALKHALFTANFTDNADPGDHRVLVDAAAKAGLDPVAAEEVLRSGRYADEVRAAEGLWRARGINAVPAIVINDRHLISGGQPVDVFERALRKVATAS
ncbi:DsbA family oxidoreductase [Sphingomonas sp. OK281]|uniref:DsbA family oxidoreductase n=1 Tax=Sphingomonas sp. OK281 TaxID=1881067 RepID=UPI0008F449CA|nr:DsbA family oxidoreductase [Sphingomonas sp. OK281]SFO40320.1 Predicted dithiol-disulfide isomerase, DsbA family [Sphingomonas sp. OK281]